MARILAALIIVQVVLACGGSDPQSPVAPSTVVPAPVPIAATGVNSDGNTLLAATGGDAHSATTDAPFGQLAQ